MIQIDREMPDRCGNCPCFHFENPMYCQAIDIDRNKKITAPYRSPRPEWCPLQEVPDAQASAAWNKRAPAVPSVPLDKLCEWLAAENAIIPCHLCDYFKDGRCIVENDMKTPCPAGTDEWRKVLEKGMEE